MEGFVTGTLSLAIYAGQVHLRSTNGGRGGDYLGSLFQEVRGCRVICRMTKAGPVGKSKSAAARHFAWELLSCRRHATSCRFHAPRLSRSRHCARWRQGSLSVPRHPPFPSTKRPRPHPGGASCENWKGRSPSCPPRIPSPDWPLQNCALTASRWRRVPCALPTGTPPPCPRRVLGW